MWTSSAIALLLFSFGIPLVLSLVFARKDMWQEAAIFFDIRVLRSAVRGLRRFRLKTLLRIVFFAAIACLLVPIAMGDPLILVGAFLTSILLVLGMTAWRSLTEPFPRRRQPKLKFPSAAEREDATRQSPHAEPPV
ncbi:MAG: hypothetical protein AAFX06_16110 [Planctomycetota bacterium]